MYPKKKRFQNRVITGGFSLSFSLFISLLCWLALGYSQPDRLSRGVGFLFCIATGYLLIMLNNKFNLIRIRASIQTSVFILLVAICPTLHAHLIGNVAALFLLATLYLLFKAYQHPRPAPLLFHACAFLGAGSIMIPHFTFLLPIVWIGAYHFQALDIRSLCASLLGWSLPYWFLFGYAQFHNDMELFYRPFTGVGTFTPPFMGLEPWMTATLGYAGVLFLVSAIHYFTASNNDKLRTRGFLQLLILLTLCILSYIILQPTSGISMFPSLFLGTSFLVGHFFVLTSGRASNIFFIFALTGLVLLLGFNVWTLS